MSGLKRPTLLTIQPLWMIAEPSPCQTHTLQGRPATQPLPRGHAEETQAQVEAEKLKLKGGRHRLWSLPRIKLNKLHIRGG